MVCTSRGYSHFASTSHAHSHLASTLHAPLHAEMISFVLCGKIPRKVTKATPIPSTRYLFTLHTPHMHLVWKQCDFGGEPSCVDMRWLTVYKEEFLQIFIIYSLDIIEVTSIQKKSVNVTSCTPHIHVR